MKIALTGVTGNMGKQALNECLKIPDTEYRLLVLPDDKRVKQIRKEHKKELNRIEIIYGNIADKSVCERLVNGVDYVVNMAAVIPPHSDQYPQKAIECNEVGVGVLVNAIEQCSPQPKFIHISTVALYGNRNEKHMWGRVGDPLLISPFDLYSLTKMRGEFKVLESDIKTKTVIRQTAMLHSNMLSDNMSDGLMFHTAFDSPLEWVTAHDSGVLIRKIVERFAQNAVPEKFWKRCHNIAGGKTNRNYGITSFDDGFVIIGGKTVDFFRPGDNATRNFHGVWFLDGDELNDMFAFQSQTTDDYWKEVFRTHPVFKLGKAVPKRVIGYFMFRRLYKDRNAPHYWAKHRDDARLTAYFGGRDNYEKLQRMQWKDFPTPDRNDIAARTDNDTPVYYGFDYAKPDGELTTADLAAVAAAHGGKLIGEFDGDMYKKLEWITQDGERFTASAYTVLRAGHWYNPLYTEFVWDFDRLAKKDKVFASVWYDTHGADENITYSLDERFNAHADKFSQAVNEL